MSGSSKRVQKRRREADMRAKVKAAKKARAKEILLAKALQKHRDNSITAAPPHITNMPQLPDAAPRSWKTSLERWITLLGLPGLVVGVVFAVPSFLPRLEIVNSSSVDTQSSFPALFSVINNGLLDVHDIKLVCRLNNVSGAEGGTMTQFGITTPALKTDHLSPTDSYEFECPVAKAFKRVDLVASVDMDIIVTCRPAFSFFRSTRCARFVTEPNREGALRWFKRPTETCTVPESIIVYTGP